MAIGTHITLPTTPYGNKVQTAMNDFQRVIEELLQLKAISDSYTSGGTVKVNLENVAVGISTGDGATVYDDVVTLLAAINTVSVSQAVRKYIG